MRFEVREYKGQTENLHRRWGVEQVDIGPLVLEFTSYATNEPEYVGFTRDEAVSLCTLMNDLFAKVENV